MIGYDWRDFKEVYGGEVGARAAFEKACAQLIRMIQPGAQAVRPSPGDQGVDIFVGDMGKSPIIVYQCKFFVETLGPTQKRQIRSSFEKAIDSEDFDVSKWVLCVPKEFSVEENRWWAEFRTEALRQVDCVEILTGDHLLREAENHGLTRIWFRDRPEIGLLTNVVERLESALENLSLHKHLDNDTPKNLNNTSIGSSRVCEDQVVTKLRAKVNEFWINGLFAESKSPLGHLNVRAKKLDNVVTHPWSDVVEFANIWPEEFTPLYAYERSAGSMLILGDPGAGKTYAILQIAEALLSDAFDKNAPGSAPPVIFSLSSWRGQRIEDWLVEELVYRYRVKKRTSRRLIEENGLTILLDGLDELPDSIRGKCVNAINAFCLDVSYAGLVVCSRSDEYESAKVKLALNAAITLLPLSKQDVVSSLSKLDSGAKELQLLICEKPDILSFASNPLILGFMSSTPQAISSAIRSSDEVATLDTVLDRFIKWTFENRTYSENCFGEAATRAWLSQTAFFMKAESISLLELENLQTSLLPAPVRLLFVTSIRVAIGALLGVLFVICVPAECADLDGKSYAPEFNSYYVCASLGATSALVATVSDATWHCFFLPKTGQLSFAQRVFTFVFAFASSSIYGLLSLTIHNDVGFLGVINIQLYILGFAVLVSLLFASLGAQKEAVDRIATSERTAFDPKAAFAGAVACSFASFFMAFCFWPPSMDFDVFETVSRLFGPSVVFGATMGGIGYGTAHNKKHPNQGMLLTFKRALFLGALVFGLGMLSITIASLPYQSRDWEIPTDSAGKPDLRSCKAIGDWLSSTPPFVFFFSFLVLCFGGYTLVLHSSLRILLAIFGVLPFRAVGFFNYAAKLRLMRRVGGSYLFCHNLVLEYFAARIPDSKG